VATADALGFAFFNGFEDFILDARHVD